MIKNNLFLSFIILIAFYNFHSYGMQPSYNKQVSQQLLVECQKKNARSNKVKELLEKGANPLIREPQLMLTCLHYACLHNNLPLAKTLVEFQPKTVNAFDRNLMTPLFFAQKQDLIDYLVSKGADVIMHKAVGNTTPLHFACHQNYIEAAKSLISHGANINFQDNEGSTPLMLACEENHEEIVKLLLNNNADVNIKNNVENTALHKACGFANLSIISLLVKNGANINAKDNFNDTPLMNSITNTAAEKIIPFLLENGAETNNFNKNHSSPLLWASVNGKIKVVQALLTKANPNDHDESGVTALHLAVLFDKPNVCRLLLDKGADPHLLTSDGYSPVDIAYIKKHQHIIKIFKEYNIQTEADKKADENMRKFIEELNQENRPAKKKKKRPKKKKATAIAPAAEAPQISPEVITQEKEPIAQAPIETVTQSSPISLKPIESIQKTIATPVKSIPQKSLPQRQQIAQKPAPAQQPQQTQIARQSTKHMIHVDKNLRWPKVEKMQNIIKEQLKQLAHWPRVSADIKQLKTPANQPPLYRLRIGDYRIIFSVNSDEQSIFIHRIDLRKNVYKNFLRK